MYSAIGKQIKISHGFFIMGFAILFTFTACEKITDSDPDKLPAKLKFDFTMTDFALSGDKDQENTQQNGLTSTDQIRQGPDNQHNQFIIDTGTIVIRNIEFEGRRTQGQEHIYFMTDFPSAHEINLADPDTQPEISFDIPQGNYYLIEITLHLGTSELSSLIMQGNYTHPARGEIPVILDYGPAEQIRIRARTTGNQTNFALSREEDSRGSIELDTDSLMRLVNYGMIVNATLADREGEEILLIDENINPGLFNSISARLPHAFTLVIE